MNKTRLVDKVSASLNERQHKALQRVLREGPEGFEGGLSAGNYIAITGAIVPTAMVAIGCAIATALCLLPVAYRFKHFRPAES